MADDTTLPQIRPDLAVHRLTDQAHVVKLRARRQYFQVGPKEAFLLEELQQPRTRSALKAAYKQRFGERLSSQDVRDFVELARKRKLLVGDDGASGGADPEDADDDEDILATSKQSLLYFRIPLVDPNETFNRWEPSLRWIWTPGFLIVSAALMLLALLVLWSNRGDLVSAFPEALRWETVLLAWAVIIASTALHETAHGLTCKHFGGDVHDTGVLFMLFMPCLYCNVSDAWLIREKWKRLWITAAGGYCDLCVWALAVFVWRLTVQYSLVNHLAFVALTVCGGRSLLNFNPLLRLDGYYLLSDWLSVPNLRKRGQEYWMSHLRWLLWGAARPPNEPGGRVLLAYGAMCWGFAIVFLDLVFIRLLQYSSNEFGVVGIVLTCLLALVLLKRVFKGFFESEFMTMLTERKGRTVKWTSGIAAIIAGSFIVPVKHYATGEFEVRPGERHQIGSPVSGYVRTVYVNDGETVSAGAPLMQLESADLENQIAVKRSELTESEALLTKLQAGTRPEELADQRARIERLEEWCEQGRRQLTRSRSGLEHELIGLDQEIAQTQAELQYAQVAFRQSGDLYRQGALAGAELRSEQTRLTVLQAQVRQAEAQRRAREAEGLRQVEAELIAREQQLADTQAKLKLLETGTRPEDVAAEQARRDRLAQELSYLQDRRERLVVRAPADGVVATPRIQEQVGTLAAQGAALCVVEDASQSFIEISVPEEEIVGLEPGQTVYLKARAIPFETFTAAVDRIAPSTKATLDVSTAATTLVVYCGLENADGRLRTGMSGFGRVDRGWNSLGVVLARKALRYLRTEFWW